MTTFLDAIEDLNPCNRGGSKGYRRFQSTVFHIYRGSVSHRVPWPGAIRSTQRHTRRQRIIRAWRQGV